ncbi:MAG: hypothetical protein ACD_56C00156G0003 [uncultured bacterium]|nr:MAG: hypothetical protein ACD_56C00156G0003 [uncultured bacterium]
MGNVTHGEKIIQEFSVFLKKFPFQLGFKFQYRHLDSFIHADYQNRLDLKYVKRFSETRLSPEDMQKLQRTAKNCGFVTICTPFDEPSVDLIEEHGFEIIKIASCSMTDWPLLEKIAQASKPIIFSSAGASLEEIDRVVSFFEHRKKDLALMHCVGEYPTPKSRLELNQIDLLRSRYPNIQIGYSTHEDPGNDDSIKIAIAKGAFLFEKHVGLPTKDIKLNAYSAHPGQIMMWLEAAREAFEMCGVKGQRHAISESEKNSLLELRRGSFAAKPIKAGQKIHGSDVFFCIPTLKEQITANDWSKYSEYEATHEIAANAPILNSNTKKLETREKVYSIVQKVKSLIKESQVVIPGAAEIEISHHYGIEKFFEFGITMITVVNRQYCKKLIIVLPQQTHPEQYHEQKEETFYILYGDLTLWLNGVERECRQGDVITIEKKVRHSFKTKKGAVIEEISSTHLQADSIYTDPEINNNTHRKTFFMYWLD